MEKVYVVSIIGRKGKGISIKLTLAVENQTDVYNNAWKERREQEQTMKERGTKAR